MAVKKKCNHELVAGLGYKCCPVCKKRLRLCKNWSLEAHQDFKREFGPELLDQAVQIANSLLGVKTMKIPTGLVENIEKSVEIKEQAG